MNDQDIAQARTAVEKILTALGVARIIYVDDANNESVAIENVLVASRSLSSELLLHAFPEIGNTIPEDPEILNVKIREAWGLLDPKVQLERGQAVVIAAYLNEANETNDDLTYVSILRELIPSDKLISLSPLQWEDKKNQLLSESKRIRTLFLFDKDFATGDSDVVIKIIAELLARSDIDGLICALLTHLVTPENQPQMWVELSQQHNIPRDRFVVIPKRYLSETPILIAQTLKFTVLSPDFTELKERTKAIIEASATAAAKRVDDISIYDLDHILFQVSANEGLWEPDMLFRLHSMFHQSESRRLAHEGGMLEEIAAKLRVGSGIPSRNIHLPTPDSSWALQREEMYEFDDYINENHQPLELGDIFTKIDGDSIKKYILLAQPCDLMVRTDGKRYPELDRIPLAEVVSADKCPYYSEEMPYFDKSPSKKWFVKLKSVHFVRIHLLDLCVFNKDGVAKMIVGGSAPSGIRPSWKARYEILYRYWRKVVSKAEEHAINSNDSKEVAQVKQRIVSDLCSLLFYDDLFKGKLDEIEKVQSVMYNCKRIGRLSRARAIGMLMSYTATLGRPAYELDFGKPHNSM
ncbi:MAG: hypothetical protein HGB11_13965 [Chlorobiales bacterium]|nr:hypothetical protein [Chlorobiales bacterium]